MRYFSRGYPERAYRPDVKRGQLTNACKCDAEKVVTVNYPHHSHEFCAECWDRQRPKQPPLFIAADIDAIQGEIYPRPEILADIYGEGDAL